MKKSLSTRINELLKKNRKWWSGYQLENAISDHKGSSIGRVAREMAEEKIIEKNLKWVENVHRHCVEYRFKTKKL